MARRVRTVVDVIDDFDGTVHSEADAENLQFAFDGTAYEIDLSLDHAAQVRELLGPLIERSRRLGKAPRDLTQPRKAQTKALAHSDEPPALPPSQQGQGEGRTAAKYRLRNKRKEIRLWAQSQGIDQALTGKISEETVTAWNAAHPDDPVPAWEGKKGERLEEVN